MISWNLPPAWGDQLMALVTKYGIMREYGALAYVPWLIADNAMCGMWALRQVRGVGVENVENVENVDGLELKEMEHSVCSAGVDFSVARSLCESLLSASRFAAGEGLGYAASGDHLDIVDAFIGTLGVDVEAAD